MLLLASFAFLSGIVTILSPCILPVLPIVLSGSVGGDRRPAGIIAGFIASFTVFTLTLSALVQWLNIPSDALRTFSVVILILFGIIMLVPALGILFERFTARLGSGRGGKKNRKGFAGGFVTGLTLGLIWTPCVGPIMASVISLAITQSIDGGAVLIVLAYSLGTSIPMLGIMKGGRKLLDRLSFLKRRTGVIQKAFGVLLIITGLSVGFQLDRKFQTAVLDLFPSYGEGLTFFENSDAVKRALDDRSPNEDMEMNPAAAETGRAPEIVTAGQWFNSAPLTMKDLEGKVVIIDFWTYSCINCVRTIPYLRSWYQTYKDEGLVIIGVHSPEFAFEREPDNVRKAIEDLNITWPVVLDNQFAQWRAYDNRYWPAKYFIDRKGNIRHSHFGEGGYEESESVIRRLIEEEGISAGAFSPAGEEERNEALTAETYLGYGRTDNFISPGGLMRDSFENYDSGRKTRNGEWSLQGRWAFTKEYVVNDGPGTLELGFHAKDVFLVIEPAEPGGELQVSIDGQEPAIIKPDESRHYRIAELEEAGEHVLTIKVTGKMRLYAFTFG